MVSIARALLMLWIVGRIAFAQDALGGSEKVVALVFLSSECPISNKMAPEIERLHRKFRTNDVAVWLVYPNRSDSAELIAKHRREYRLTAPYARDPAHELVKRAGVTITPEAAVFDQSRVVVYRGRITDQFLTIGKARPEPTVHDLEEAIEAAVAGRKPARRAAPAVGCFIEEK